MNKKILKFLSISSCLFYVSGCFLIPELPEQEHTGGDTETCSHSGYHYLGKTPTCVKTGYKDFYYCTKCEKTSLTPLEGDFIDKEYEGSIKSGHIAYLPKDKTNHSGFDETGVCAAGCGKTLKEYYGLSSNVDLNYTLKDVTKSNDYDDFTSIGSGITGNINVSKNKNFDLYFDFSYNYESLTIKDSWFIVSLFAGTAEHPLQIRFNTRNVLNDGIIKGFVYFEGGSFEGNVPISPSEENAYKYTFTNKKESGFIHINVECTNETNNTFNLKLFVGQIGNSDEHQVEVNNSPITYTFTLGENYLNSERTDKCLFKNFNSNVQIKNHEISEKVILADNNGNPFGSLPIDNTLTLPPLVKEGYDFNGWVNEDGDIVTPSEVTNNMILKPSFSRQEGTPIQETFTIQSGSSVNQDVDLSLGSDEYITIEYETNQPIVGEFSFVKNTTTITDQFYLDKNETTFSIFLDSFRKNSTNQKGDKTLVFVKYKNVGEASATLKIKNIKHSNKSYFGQDEYTIEDNNIRAGMRVSLGGGLSLLQNKNAQTVEYIDNSNNVLIKTRDKIANGSIKKEIVSNPNLINIYDHGREIQQSYYMNVDESNGYEVSQYLGANARYNPVQSGDQHLSESRIIDYNVTTNSIYVKVQAVDWAKNNVLTKSYMENTYTINNGLLYVKNSFVDFYGFTNYNEYRDQTFITENAGKYSQELPAIYISHPLNYFATELEDKTVFDKNLGWNTSIDGVSGKTTVNNVNQLVKNADDTYRANLEEGKYFYGVRKHPTDWCGFFNEDKFGVGLYFNPGEEFRFYNGAYRSIFTAGVYSRNQNTSEEKNRAYYYNGTRKSPTSLSFISSPKESCYVDNNNYITTLLGLVIREYSKFEWSYALGADYMSTLKSKFASIKSSGQLVNNFSSMTGACI